MHLLVFIIIISNICKDQDFISKWAIFYSCVGMEYMYVHMYTLNMKHSLTCLFLDLFTNLYIEWNFVLIKLKIQFNSGFN